ncbi:MAG: hypothetical protein C0614_04480 [Desulfuromonas sp.]|nr:MAG: hypothetical protein C0614_04480 [Desulfuromonas sp.]
MFKQLKIYYFFVSLPFVLLLTGATLFFDGIKVTITRNPHPQINYTIFAIILIGGVLVLLNTRRLVREARSFREFFRAVHAKIENSALQKLANSATGETACLMQMVAATEGRRISHQEQVAIEHELTNARSSLLRRNALPQYLTGLLVGMGLLGTFIGLLATLNDITVLISSFADLDMQNASPLLVFRTMIERMKAPMQSMGIAFSASMFGLLGSIILGLMMVGLRRLQGDMFSILSSEVARHIELALAQENEPFASSGQEVSGDVTGVLMRIEERYADAARSQQRALTALVDDLQKQRSDLVRALAEQTEVSRGVRSELQQVGRQLVAFGESAEQNSVRIADQVSELTVRMAGDAKEIQQYLSEQIDEQKRLRQDLGSYKVEERLAEAARMQQRALTVVIDDIRQQRGEMLQALLEQTEANHSARSELRQVGGQLEGIHSIIGKGHDELATRLADLTVRVGAESRESRLAHEETGKQLAGQLREVGSQIDAQLGTLSASQSKGHAEICEQVAVLMQHLDANEEQAITLLGRQLDEQQKLFTAHSSQHAERGKENSQLRTDLHQLATQLLTLGSGMEKGHGRIVSQVAELAGQVQSGTSGSHNLLTKQLGEQQKLLEALVHYKTEHNENGVQVRDELQQLGSQLGLICGGVEKGNDQLSNQLAQLIAHMATATPPAVDASALENDSQAI